ncbi:MAG: phytanoyl-CoA dioxygenase family protein [Lentisphaeria bacterium]|nr:phytanoyl-CoA dioxygenase family protein [Lentisphaeria bacterium]
MLTQEHQNVYHDQGYVIIPNFFNKREVEAMQAELQRFINEGLGRM